MLMAVSTGAMSIDAILGARTCKFKLVVRPPNTSRTTAGPSVTADNDPAAVTATPPLTNVHAGLRPGTTMPDRSLAAATSVLVSPGSSPPIPAVSIVTVATSNNCTLGTAIVRVSAVTENC